MAETSGRRMANPPVFADDVPFLRRIIEFDEEKEQTSSMPSITEVQRVLDLAAQKGLLRARDLNAYCASRLTRPVKTVGIAAAAGTMRARTDGKALA